MVTCSSPSASNLSNRGLTPQDNLKGRWATTDAHLPFLVFFSFSFFDDRLAVGCAVPRTRGMDQDRTRYGYWPSVFRLSIPAAICGPTGSHVRAGGAPYAGRRASIWEPPSSHENEDTKNRIPFLSKGDPASMIRLYVVDNLQSRKASYQNSCTITLECKTTSTPI